MNENLIKDSIQLNMMYDNWGKQISEMQKKYGLTDDSDEGFFDIINFIEELKSKNILLVKNKEVKLDNEFTKYVKYFKNYID